jgi:hypothetical protein
MTPPVSDELCLAAVEAMAANQGNQSATAAALGIARSTLQKRLKNAARRGLAPGHFENGVAPGYLMGKVTVQRAADGTVERTWERQSPDQMAAAEARREIFEALVQDMPRSPPVSAPAGVMTDLCNLYTFTDYHLGCLAWHKEGGQDWDLAIAVKVLCGAMQAMIAQSPKAHTAIINVQGDFLHTDGKLPLTPTSKHVLDADTRFPKLRQAAIRLIRQMVAWALESHSEVHLIVAEGNHDEESAGWLADLFTVFYEKEPRLTVNDSQLPFYVFVWGETMLGIHHGHKVKNEQLPLLFASQFPKEWGRTRRREIHCGHRHHRDEKEYNGVTVIQHPTLAARDAYAARGGWIADRASWAITYHKRWGGVGRVCITPEMLEVA